MLTTTTPFTVGITRLAIVYQEVTVAAATPEDAAQQALMRARDGGTDGWQIDDTYNDGQDHSKLCVISCADEAGEEHNVDLTSDP